MVLPHELKFLARPLGIFAYEPSWAGLLRIIGWTLVFLLLAGKFIPQPPVDVPAVDLLKGTRVTPMSGTLNDPRWVRRDIETFPKDKYTNIAWLAASPVYLLKAGEQGADVWASVEFMPDKVNEFLESRHDIKAKTFLYLITSRRVLDTYTMALDALTRQPDAIVLTIDPLWILNSQVAFYRPSVFNRGAELWWNENDWPWLFTLASPANHLWSWVGKHFPLVATSHDYQRDLIERGKALLGVDLEKLREKGAELTAEKEVKEVKKEKKNPQADFRQSLMFWVLFRTYDGDLSYFFPEGEMSVTAWQNAAMALANSDPATWPPNIVHKTLKTLKNSGIPTFIYLSPVAAQMQSSQLAMDGYNEVRKFIADLKSEYAADNFKILADIPPQVVESMSFQDYLHVDKGGMLPEFLADEISDILVPQ